MNPRSPRDRLTYVFIVIIILMGLEIVYLTVQNHKLKAIIENPEKYFKTLSKEEIVPSFAAQDINGNDVSVRYSPTEPHTMLFWFGPNCSSCQDNLAFWKHVYDKCNSERLRFLGMFVGNPDEAREFVSERGLEFPVIYANHPHIVESYKGNVLPQTILIDPEGAVRGTWPGVLGETKREEILAALETLSL